MNAEDGAKQEGKRPDGMKALLLMLCVCGISFGQQHRAVANDVGGWGKVRWGMTTAQAKAVYPQAEASTNQESIDLGERLRIPHFPVGDREMVVRIGSVDHSQRIGYVNIELPDENFSASSINHAAVYEELLNSLTLKYGKPTRMDKEPKSSINVTNATWVYPSTTIDLQYTEIKVGFGIVLIHYERSKKMSTAL